MKFPASCFGSSLCGQMIKAAWHQMSPGEFLGVEQCSLVGELNAAAVGSKCFSMLPARSDSTRV